jgi:hypothetical protein
VVGQTNEGYKTEFKGYAEPEVVDEDCFRDGGEKVFDASAQALGTKRPSCYVAAHSLLRV